MTTHGRLLPGKQTSGDQDGSACCWAGLTVADCRGQLVSSDVSSFQRCACESNLSESGRSRMQEHAFEYFHTRMPDMLQYFAVSATLALDHTT